MMMPSKKMSLILALALFAGVLGMGMGVLAQGTEPVEKKQRGEVTAVQAADAPLEADRANKGAAKLPQGALASFGRLPFQNGSRIHASELSPDGKLLATLSSRSTTVWNTATGQPVFRFFFDVPAWPCYQRGLAFSPDNKRLACGPSSEHIFVWDLASGKELRRFSTKIETFDFSFFRFSVDSTAIIVESNNVISWLNVETGATVCKLSGLRIKLLSPDDKTFAAVEDSKQQVHIGDTKTGKIAHTLSIAAKKSSAPGVLFVLFLPDGVTLAVARTWGDSTKEGKQGYRTEVQFWDITTGKRRETTWSLITTGHSTYRLAISPNGKVLHFHGSRYALDTGKELAPIALVYYTTAIFPHPDGKTLFAVGLEEIRRWDIATGTQISKDRDFCRWLESTVSPDGRWLALRGAQYRGGFLELCDTGSRQAKRIAWPWGNGAHIAFTADSRSLICNEYYHLQFLTVPRLALGKKLVPAGKFDIEDASLPVSGDGRHLAVVRSTGLLRLFDLTTDKQVWSLEGMGRALFTPDGKRLLAQSRQDRAIRLHDLATKKILFEVQSPNDRSGRGSAWISAWAFDPRGRLLAVAMTGGHVIVLDAATGNERFRFLSMPTVNPLRGLREYYQHATALAFSADGQWLAVGGDDGYLRIWEVSTRRELHRLHGHEGATQALGFSADGRRLVSFGAGEGFLWDLRPRRVRVKGPNPFVGSGIAARENPPEARGCPPGTDCPIDRRSRRGTIRSPQ